MIRDDALHAVRGDYRVGDERAAPEGWVRAARRVRRHLSRELRPADPPTARRVLPDADYLVSRKADGEFAVLVVADGHAALVNPGGTVRVGLPLLDAARTALAEHAPVALAGELVATPPDDRRERVHDVVRIARSPRSDDDLERLRFEAFDLVDLEAAAPVDAPLADRWARLGDLLPAGGLVTRVPGRWGRAADVHRAFEEWAADGAAEGVVARSDRVGGVKIKERHTLDAAVIGFTVGADDRADLLHDLLVAVLRPDGAFHVLGRVGGGFSDDDRRAIAADLRAIACASTYIETNSDQAAYTLVRPERVVEMTVLDVVTETSTGLPVESMVVHYDAAAERWSPVRRLPLGSPISPQFVRLRDDKAVHPGDVGIDQVTRIVPVDRVDEDASDLDLPASELLKREAFTKASRGALMVRKLLLWKTNKETVADYPAYVVLGVDFSPNRKDPLQREIRVAIDEAGATRHYAALRDDYVKTGWELAATDPDPAADPAPPSGPLPL